MYNVRRKGSKNKKGTKRRGSHCSGHNQSDCLRMSDCLYTKGKSRKFCRRHKITARNMDTTLYNVTIFISDHQ